MRTTSPSRQSRIVPNIEINERILPLLTKKKRVKILVGGRGSGKSVGIADIIMLKCREGLSILGTREFQGSIEDSVHSLIEARIGHHELNGFTVTGRDISHHSSGGRVFYKGLSRNVSSLKSLGAVDICWIEEGESIGEKSLQTLTPSIRSLSGSPPEIWISMNRHSMLGAVATKYLHRAERSLAEKGYYEDDLVMVIQLNYSENPWFPPELDMERIDDKKRLSPSAYAHIWEGQYYDDLENSIIKSEWFDSCINSHLKLGFSARGQKVLAYDPSDEGADDKALVVRHGSVITHCAAMDNGDIAEGTDWALNVAASSGCDEFVWDCDGMGVALKRQVAQGFDNYTMFKGSESPDDKLDAYIEDVEYPVDKNKSKTNGETFKNKRAQYYWRLRDRMLHTHEAIFSGGNSVDDEERFISFSESDIGMDALNKLRYELCRVPLKPNPNGMIQIMSKPNMVKEGIPSPNRADALMMSMIIPDEDTTFDLDFASNW